VDEAPLPGAPARRRDDLGFLRGSFNGDLNGFVKAHIGAADVGTRQAASISVE
jgi:hypothetical protein